MRAYQLQVPGGPAALKLVELPDPAPEAGHVLIRVRAFGINRSEHFTRRGLSPGVALPRVLGIECVGTVIAAPGTTLQPGTTVAAMMGGMGRQYDGSYAEQVRVPAAHVFPLTTKLPWAILGALPEMFQTAAGSLSVGLEVERAQSLLVRGGTASVGMTAIVLARQRGLRVLATTRNPAKSARLRELGAEPIIDTGLVADQVRALLPQGVDRVLELVGTSTLLDSLQATAVGGIVCMTGMLGDAWTLPDFSPMGNIPSGVKLTSYSGGSGDITVAALQAFVSAVEAGELSPPIGLVLPFEQVVEAHRRMDNNDAGGKIVVTVGNDS
jgi:NADPH:quinone reductase